MTLFRNLDINQDFYFTPDCKDPNQHKYTKVSGGKASDGCTIARVKSTHIVFYKKPYSTTETNK